MTNYELYSNPFDRYAIAAMKLVTLVGISRQQVVEHLPKEISRFTWFIMEHGAAVAVKIVDIKHRRSPLVQGGLEIPIEFVVVMLFSAANKQAIDKYKRLVDNHYEEPIDKSFAIPPALFCQPSMMTASLIKPRRIGHRHGR